MTYITTLYNQEFHLIARPEIKSISDLANQKVSVDVQGAGTAVTAARLFDLLGFYPVGCNGGGRVSASAANRW
jgi:TRAP-type uncharacterized transport system substrate-binding protein